MKNTEQETVSMTKKLTKKHLIIGIAFLLIVAVFAILYFNSVGYLKKKITSKTWYASYTTWVYNPNEKIDIDSTDLSISASDLNNKETVAVEALNMYLNGDVEIVYFTPTEGDILFDKKDVHEWELMKDKTLKIGDKYYKWKEDWHLFGNKLVIVDREYSVKDPRD